MNESDLRLSAFSFERRFDERGQNLLRYRQSGCKTLRNAANPTPLVLPTKHNIRVQVPQVDLLRTHEVFPVLMMIHKNISEHLGDTAFVVLRKQKLIFLHWYHHITVLLYSWYSYKDMVAGGGWFMTMNYGVHALMYSYYAARAAGLRVPRPLAVLVTSAQILQMAMGLTVSALVYRWLPQGDCPSRVDNVTWATLMYLSYLLLFSRFFYRTYLRRPDKLKAQ
uniref:Elongation of very long chain fatty acids protein n=1 Tax=Fundulus heteroclitus TaxID=8078 RepID=A0A3Q2QGV5_FUNHE